MTHIVPTPLLPSPSSDAAPTAAAVHLEHLSYTFGSVRALDDVSMSIPRGALYALLGPNGSGKTTLLHLLMGMRRPRSGCLSVFGRAVERLTLQQRSSIGYVAEGQQLPGWMRLEQVEAYLSPMYDTWDAALANHLRKRFELDPTRKIRTLSRGEQMKAALLCALAPRPRLLIMDEPFTGMDAIVKDEIARGLLEAAAGEDWTVLLCSHDIGELELLADWVGILDRGRVQLSAPLDVVRERYKHVEVTLKAPTIPGVVPSDWLALERAGTRLAFVVATDAPDVEHTVVRPHLGAVAHVAARPATLREVFVAVVRHSSMAPFSEVAA